MSCPLGRDGVNRVPDRVVPCSSRRTTDWIVTFAAAAYNLVRMRPFGGDVSLIDECPIADEASAAAVDRWARLTRSGAAT